MSLDDIRRPHGAGVERVTVSLDPEKLTELDDLGREWGFTRSEMVRIAIVKLLRDPLIFFRTTLSDTKQSANRTDAIVLTGDEPNGEGEAA